MPGERRAIRFRAWDHKENKYLDGGCISSSMDGGNYLYLSMTHGLVEFMDDDGGKNGLHEHEERIDVDRFEVEQFTGLHDKNGREIYEGDFIGTPTGFRGDVFWCDLDAEWKLHYENGTKVCRDSLCLFARPEVIGNIHENPELLK